MYARCMSRSRAVRSGFSAVFLRPWAFAAELAWRWTFGAAALLLLAYGILLFLSSTPVSDRDLMGLAGIIPGSARSAIQHIARGSGPRLLALIFSMAFGLSFLWWLASGLGRAAVIQELLPERKLEGAAALGRVFQLQLVRTTVFLIALLAYVAAFAVSLSAAPMTTANGKPASADFTVFCLIFLPITILFGWLWSSLNWCLSVAPIVAVRHGSSTFASFSGAIRLSLRSGRQFLWTGFVFGAVRLILVFLFLSFALTTFGIFAQFSGSLAMAAVFVVFLGYCALSDFVGIARFAAYVRIIEWVANPEPAMSFDLPAKVDLDSGPVPESV
ncbi:MAG: hypothetical protein JWO13_3385 [Acidobacteriales bacterium]|nr:hypothetical protein [Terriglobales bacterium]